MSRTRPRAEVVVVGSELLRGIRADRNGPFLALALGRSGVETRRITLVPDDRSAIAQAVRGGLEAGVDVLVVAGGLGPTEDDCTREAVAQAVGVELELREDLVPLVRARALSFGDEGEEHARRQSLVFRGGRWCANEVGVAPGLAIDHGSTAVYVLPGPPRELQDLFARWVKLELASALPTSWGATVRTVGLRETAVSELLRHLALPPDVEVAYLPGPATVDIVLSGGEPHSDDVVQTVIRALGPHVYATDERSLEDVVEGLLVERGQFVVTAESCTGGMVADLLTSVPGSSRCFLGGVVAYSNELKERLLGVPADLLRAHGAVSAEVARAMALGALERIGGDWAVSITGIAGPGGGSADKPVGLVFHALARPEGTCEVRRHLLGGDRQFVRLASARLALDLLRRGMLELP